MRDANTFGTTEKYDNIKIIKTFQTSTRKSSTMYAKGTTTRQISETLEDIYGFETSEGFIFDVTDKILPQIENW